MLQFYDRILPKCGFVDLHNHTNDSYGEELNQMNLTPEELLESAYEYTLRTNSPATFAITDHNSIEGVQKVDLLLKSNPKKYDKIKFISGCEFTCSAGSLGEIKNDQGHVKNIFSNFHLLAYGFNPFDESLSLLCKLHSTKRANSVIATTNNGSTIKISAGAYVLSIKNILKDYGINLSLDNFKDINLRTDNISETKYINYLMTYIEKFNLDEMIKKDIFYQLSNRNIISLGRLDCFEVMEVVENAGGVCVLAHPYLLKLGSYAKANETKTKGFLKKQLKMLGEEVLNDDNVHVLALKYAISKLTKDVYLSKDKQKLKGIVGIEALHVSSTLHPNHFKRIVNLIEKNNLYVTCGSDSHGTLKKPNMLSMFTAKTNLSPSIQNDIVAKNCLFAEKLLDGTINNNIRCDKSFDEQITLVQNNNNEDNVINLQEYYKLITNTSDSNKKPISKKHQQEDKVKNIEISKIVSSGLTNLNTMIFLIKSTLENNELSGKQIVKEFTNIKHFQPPVNFALDTINKNKDLVYNKKYVIKFLKTYQEYLQLKRQFKKLVDKISKEYKKEKQNLKQLNRLADKMSKEYKEEKRNLKQQKNLQNFNDDEEKTL